MLFSFAVRSVYMESCSMFVRGGVYVVVRDSMGPFVARLSVSALVFDYILTGPISVVSAGQYLGRLLNELGGMLMQSRSASRPNTVRRVLRRRRHRAISGGANIKGIHESSGKALRIMQITTVMVVIFLIWCPLTLLLHENRAAAARARARQPAFQPRSAWAGSRAPFWPQHRASSRSSSRSATRCSP